MTKILRNLRILFLAVYGIICLWLAHMWISGGSRPTYDWKSLPGTMGFETVSDKGHFTFRIVETSGYVRPWRFSNMDGKVAQVFVGYEVRPRYGLRLDGNSIVVDTPCIIPIAFILALGAVIWRPDRFSLRTLLIATTLVAFVLGLAAVSFRL
jgi:hypothetical protein